MLPTISLVIHVTKIMALKNEYFELETEFINGATDKNTEKRPIRVKKLTEEDFKELSKKIKKMAEKAVEEEQVLVVKPEPNEERLLADILGDNFKELQVSAVKVTARQIEAFAKGAMNAAVATCDVVKTFHKEKLDFEDENNLRQSYINAIQKLSENKMMSSWVGCAIQTTSDVYELGVVLHNYLKVSEKKKIREERFKIQANELKKELIEMTVDGTLECFEKALHMYLARYYATYYKDDVSYKNGKRSYSSINNYEENFTFQGILSEKIDKQRAKLVKLKVDNDIPNSYSSYDAYVRYIMKKDYLQFVKNDKRQEFALKLKLYRAYLKQGEFDKQRYCGDRNEVRRALLCTLFVGLGTIAGLAYGVIRIKNELKWKRNIATLKETMRTYLKYASKINWVLEKKYTIEKLKYYNDLTKSKYGIYLLEKNLEELSYEFKNKDCEKSFEAAFNLLQKMSNTGIADRENYVHLNFEFA